MAITVSLSPPACSKAMRSRRTGGALLPGLIACAAAWAMLPMVAFVPGPSGVGGLGRQDAGKLGMRQASPQMETAPVEAKVVSPEEDRETFRALALTLLQRYQNAKPEDIGFADTAELDYQDFCALLGRLNLADTSEVHCRRLFAMLDQDSSGTIDKSELKARLRDSEAISEMYSEGLKNTGVTVATAIVLAAAVGVTMGWSNAADFLTAYVVEDSLSVDNLFVFLLLFNYFKVPPALQNYCLNLGIVGAVVLRGVFIFIGLSAVKSFQPLLLFFAAFLVYASYTGLTAGDEDEDEEDEPPEIVQSILAKLPTTDQFHGDKLAIEGPKGGWLLTPLALCIIAVELCDILFAVDSIPAVFAVTSDPLIVFTSNVAAIMGLRSLYQVLSVAAQDLVYLEKAVAVVLGFVGLKLGLEVFHVEVSSVVSLAVIIGVLGVGVAASLYEQNKDEYSTMIKKAPNSYFGKLLSSIKQIVG